ncbi:MAG: multidrug efflux pump subunit AcrA (membrane-fusion protein) [Paraglaciecola sp.]|jgi:multidrug efflux pump subunit AcrA (membrane-fusion protein)
MSIAHDDFMGAMKTLHSLKAPRTHTTIIWLVVTLVLGATLLLTFTPWVQTAYGTGTVNSPDPLYRIQPISALLNGQIEQWHVREGDPMLKGQPIVTLVDVYSDKLEKLRSEQAAANQRYIANKLSVENALSSLSRHQELLAEGLISSKDLEVLAISLDKLKVQAAKTEEDLDRLKMILARQEKRTKVAPMNGTVVRLKSGGNATYVKAGDILGWFVPANIERQINIKISGFDAALITAGRKVKIQFEGWPTFQFSGWTGMSAGTFEGVVSFVEPVADENGLFAIWITPAANAKPWPKHESARLGSRVKAWILLEEVRLGYELWRQLNSFPAVRQQQDSK